jgi:glycosyltransferase involved in cell wall biosynthesis
MIFKLLALNFCDTFITAGGKVKEYYFSDKRFSQKQIVEIQSPVDTSVFAPSQVKEDYKIASYPGLKIITVGNINPLKGIEYLIKMASILSKQYNGLNFFVVGPHYRSQQKYSEKMREMVKKLKLINFHFYGQADNVSSILKAADIYVCSSIAEASPVSVWEAMSMAKPIVSTDVGDIARFIKNGENGFVVPIRDAVDLADKVRALIQNKELREEMGQKSRNVAVKYLDIDIGAKKHALLYKQLI